ncbi:NifU family protein [bacterium]|nr:NifU family protein [bacterium]
MEEKIKDVLNNEVRPYLQSHGGDAEFVSVDAEGNVSVRLKGACAGCSGALMTLKNLVEQALKEKIPGVKSVKSV